MQTKTISGDPITLSLVLEIFTLMVLFFTQHFKGSVCIFSAPSLYLVGVRDIYIYIYLLKLVNKWIGPGAAAHPCNPSTLGG